MPIYPEITHSESRRATFALANAYSLIIPTMRYDIDSELALSRFAEHICRREFGFYLEQIPTKALEANWIEFVETRKFA